MSRYRVLRSTDELEALIEASRGRVIVIFKHSLTCPVSSAALREYESFLEAQDGGTDGFSLIEIQKNRDVSNHLSELSWVRHESPQALVLKDGEVSWHASHWAITAASLSQALGAG